MNLNDSEYMRELDKQEMYEQIISLPEQLSDGWTWAAGQTFAADAEISNVVISGMGGSAIGADLAAAAVAHQCAVPITINRGYELPAWAAGPQTLCIASSHSGNTEETLTCYQQALERGCTVLSFSTGGKLAEMSRVNDKPHWLFHHQGQPRAAVGLSFAMVMAALMKAKLIPDPAAEIMHAAEGMRLAMQPWLRDAAVQVNPAKRLAGQCLGRTVTIFGADAMTPVARRWKGQINELAKGLANFEALPEADHNTLAGIETPEDKLSGLICLFIKASSNHPRNVLRIGHTQQLMMTAGINTDVIEAAGETLMEQMWWAILFGDLTAYYLAVANQMDPTPIPSITELKALLS